MNGCHLTHFSRWNKSPSFHFLTIPQPGLLLPTSFFSRSFLQCRESSFNMETSPYHFLLPTDFRWSSPTASKVAQGCCSLQSLLLLLLPCSTSAVLKFSSLTAPGTVTLGLTAIHSLPHDLANSSPVSDWRAPLGTFSDPLLIWVRFVFCNWQHLTLLQSRLFVILRWSLT